MIALVPETDPILKIEPASWDFSDSNMNAEKFYDLMKEHMMYHQGLGLAATQIGFPFKVFTMFVTEKDAVVCFNPEITKESDEKILMKEGCLSYPSLLLNIRRPKEVQVRYQLFTGDTVTANFVELAARIFHHEMDHMKGKTFLDYVSKVQLRQARRKQKLKNRKVK